MTTRAAASPRLRWDALPARVRDAAHQALNAAVVAEDPRPGGFSPGVASGLTLADGRRVFVKAISAARNPHAPGLYRREAAVMATLPARVPAPELLWTWDDGKWVVLVLEWVDGRSPREPWDDGELGRVVRALDDLAQALTPSPLAGPGVVEDLADNFRSWRRMSADPALYRDLDHPWARANLDRLAELEAGWERAATGDTLVHADLRADNMLLAPDGRVVFVDWPHAVTGAPWLDLLFFLPSVAATATGPVDPAALWRVGEVGRAADPDAVDAVLAALAGDWLYQSTLPAPRNVPGLRAHQRAKGDATLTWLRSRIS
ncbi:phosphotransferase family protein [Embleya hyalina]|uniref:phosphotransferase family protein n=1 Tax=Embleya hyalina TaxID=516124 RepID=UPI001FE55C4F|nr:aminoglycoside phosphotransferase family protein [Embleya hyalina]